MLWIIDVIERISVQSNFTFFITTFLLFGCVKKCDLAKKVKWFNCGIYNARKFDLKQ